MHVFLRMENLDAISIVPESERNSEGRCTIRSYPPIYKPRVWMRKRLFVLKAGAEGELLYPRSRTPGDYSDFYVHACPIMKELLGERAHPSVLYHYYDEVIQSRVRRLVKGKLREPIQKFATLLVEKKTIDRFEAHDCLVDLLGIDPDDYWRTDLLKRQTIALKELGLYPSEGN